MIDITAIETKVSTQEFTERALAYEWVKKCFFIVVNRLKLNTFLIWIIVIYFKSYSVCDSNIYINLLQNIYYIIRLLKKYLNFMYNFFYSLYILQAIK